MPVALAARRNGTLTEAALVAACGSGLAGYKIPKEIRFAEFGQFPHRSTGEIRRHELEKWLNAPLTSPPK